MISQSQHEDLLLLQDLRVHFLEDQNLVARLRHRDKQVIRAVDGVELCIGRGQFLGLVGESGSGKTTLGKSIIGLAPVSGGSVVFDSEDITHPSRSKRQLLRRRIQMIFQDPYSSLSPRLRVASLLTEPYKINRVSPEEQRSAAELLDMVGLSSELGSKYPHELSGGQARRIGIARALALSPDFLIADEPTAGLDVSAAASILNLMQDLAKQLGLTYLLITHDLDVVAYIADTIAVMYLGALMEVGPAASVLDAPSHPYTQALLSAATEPDPRRRKGENRLLLPGEIPSPKDPPPGCRFHTRCAYARERCHEEVPDLEKTSADHLAACYFWREVQQSESYPQSTQQA